MEIRDIFSFMTVLETDKALIIYTSKPVLTNIFVNIYHSFCNYIFRKCRLFVSFIKFLNNLFNMKVNTKLYFQQTRSFPIHISSNI